MSLDLAHAAHAVLDLGDDLGLAVQLLDAEVEPQLIDEGQKRNGLPEGDTLAFQPGGPGVGLGDSPSEFKQQARLADARVAREGHDLAVAALDLLEALEEDF